MKKRHTTQRDINAAERGRLAIELRKQGYTLQEIAQQCGYKDKSGAYQAIKRELDRVVVPEVQDLRRLETMRLDDMLKACYSQAQGGSLWAVDRVVVISKRRSEITGMDVRPDETAIAQNYTKRIILTHEQAGGQDASPGS